ncbi:MAG: hypothetical protein AAF351_02190 [Pseudomonadota bacterium]
MRAKITIYVAAIIVLLLPLTAPAQDEFETLGSNDGYLVVGIDISGMSYDYLAIDKRGSIGFSHKFKSETMSRGMNYRIIKLPAGTYYWRRLMGNFRYRLILDREIFEMKVEPGKINYGGDIFINWRWGSSDIRMANRATSAVEYLSECCQHLLGDLPLVYARGGGDPFLDYLATLPNYGITEP